MKKLFFFAICMVACVACQKQTNKTYSDELTTQAVVEVTQDALQWQIDHYEKMLEARKLKWRYANDNGWENAIFITSVAEWAEMLQDSSMIDWYLDMAKRNFYELRAGTHIYHADNIIAGMLYADVYDKTQNEIVLFPTAERLEYICNHPKNNSMEVCADEFYRFKYRWSWCDALFMAPQVFARYAQLLNKVELLDFMAKEYWATTDYLYDPDYHLYYRDSHYFDKVEANGKPVFWGRGNGWVLAGLARMIPYIPKEYADYTRFVEHYKTMAKTIVSLQSPEGHWHVTMLDPETFPTPEMSSTGFFAYAIWWGINEGILDESYIEPATRAWKALVRSVHPNGMLGSVQAVGEKPEAITADMTEVYGPAAMAFTAMEILKYLNK